MIKQIIIILFVLMMFPLASGTVVNSEIGNLTLYNFNASEHDIMPSGFYLGSRYLDANMLNTTLGFDDVNNRVQFYSSTINDGKAALYIGGMYPATDSTINIKMGIDRENWNAKTNVYGSNYWIVVQHRLSGVYRVTSYWNDGTLKSTYFDVAGIGTSNNIIEISIASNESNRSNVISCGAQYLETPYYRLNSVQHPYTAVSQPIMYLTNELSTSQNITTNIYSIEQTIPRKIITPHGSNQHTAFGIDGPHTPFEDKILSGAAYLTNAGGGGTVWADVLYVNESNAQPIKDMLADGWELGIHYSIGLNSLPVQDAYDRMDSEYAAISSIFGQPPTSWCSLQNADNVTHAAYAYNNLSMVWRNGDHGIAYIPTIGNIDNRVWLNWWLPTINNSAIYPTFTHTLDVEPAATYSIDYSKFQYYVDTYTGNDIKIVGFEEYYLRNANQKDAVIDIIESDDAHITFSVQTNGRPSNLNVYRDNAVPPYKIYDETSRTWVRFVENNDTSVTFEAQHNHTYVYTFAPKPTVNPPFTGTAGIFVAIAGAFAGAVSFVNRRRT